jgi:hypothetical protein
LRTAANVSFNKKKKKFVINEYLPLFFCILSTAAFGILAIDSRVVYGEARSDEQILWRKERSWARVFQ